MRKPLQILLLFSSITLIAQGTYEDYKRAERFLPQNVKRLVAKTWVEPNWIGETARFWYKNSLYNGKSFVLIDAEQNSRKPAFDHQKLAEALSEITKKNYTENQLPFDQFEFTEDETAIRFNIDTTRWECNLSDYRLTKLKPKNEPDGISPDKKWAAFIRNHNLYLRSLETGDEIQLTTDGEPHYNYAYQPDWYHTENISNPRPQMDPKVSVVWSPDSRKLLTFRLDRRDIRRLYMLQSATAEGYQSEVFSYERALPGDTVLTTIEYFIFDVEKKQKTNVDLAPFPAFLVWWGPEWFKDSQRLFFNYWHRGYKAIDLLEIDAATGKTRTILEERSATNIDMGMMGWKWIDDGKELVWLSERDGWNHLHHFDGASGNLLNRVTSGNYVVRSIEHVDQAAKQIYFSASGKESQRDPYFRHLYKINFDGSGLVLLTPEDAEHEIKFSPDGRFFVDNFSRVDLAPQSVLRRSSDGKIVQELEQADIHRLLAAGWQPPERFKAKARDGETDIYGVIFRPSNFDSTQKYPVVDATYTGPHTFRTPKSFQRGYRNQDQPIAELGFIVITVDGFGSAKRSKVFHNFSYQNLGDIGAEDHMAAMRQLAKKYKFMDLSRVGIYGHSAGGYDAARALLTQPFFYDVAVSSAGNHDHRMAKVWWPEMWMGPLGDHYKEQSNLTIAQNLRGKLLLAHGDMDNNVNPASTIRLADELIKANKDFDLLILPNADHNLSSNRFFIRKRWDYFVEHLLGVDPPKEYEIIPFDQWDKVGENNQLTEAEKAEGWQLLFDGKSFDGWRGFKKETPPKGWVITNSGELHFTAQGRGDIITDAQFEDFELQLEWKISPAGNSGIFFWVTEDYEESWQTGPEMQVLDNAWHPNGRNALTAAGANYALHPAEKDVTRNAGEFNKVRIVAHNNRIQHWLNGEKVVEYEIGSPKWNTLVRNSKFIKYSGYGKNRKGHIVLQDHGDKVWYRNIKIRALD